MRTAILFPGQGVSVAAALPLVQTQCADLLARCRHLLGEDPFARATEATLYAQPAIFLASLAGWRSLGEDHPADAFAGHSLGEMTALVAAGVIRADDGLDLVVRRARLMSMAADADIDGGMLAVLKASPADALRLAQEHGVSVANDNGGGQVVLSGSMPALRRASTAARAAGLRAIVLDVTGAFHSPAMEPATAPMHDALSAVQLQRPSAPVFSGLTARRFQDVRLELSQALQAPVRWRETMLALEHFGIDSYIDVGPESVLARLIERDLPGRPVTRVQGLHVAA